MVEKNGIKVICTWGDGPDVMIAGKAKPILLLEEPNRSGFTHGIVTSWQLDLSVEEAEWLSVWLYTIASEARKLNDA